MDQRDFIWVQLGDLKVYSCYTSPNLTIADFRSKIQVLEASIRHVPPDLGSIVAGDFNSKSFEWGSTMEDDRGVILSETMFSLGAEPANIGHLPTFRRANAELVIYI